MNESLNDGQKIADPPEFSIITFQQTPKVTHLDPADTPDWIKGNYDLVDRFVKFSNSIENALGLAANQVARKGKRLDCPFFIWRNEMNATCPINIAINPTINEKFGNPVSEIEGCLSWPGFRVHAQRHLRVNVSYWNLNGDHIENQDLGRFPSQVWQHEMDHLLGVEEIIKQAKEAFVRVEKKVQRNDPCPCGKAIDGKPKKYKKCCGR
jgi:peptide deformylase